MTERRKMPRWVRVTLFVAILVVILAAVATVPLAVGYFRPPPTPETVSGPRLRITPSKLFTGELKRIEPHLGLTTGCVKLEPIGMEPELYIGLRCEIRRAGQPPQDLGDQTGLTHEPMEASFSLREINDPNDRKRYELITAVVGKTGGTGTQPLPDFWPKSDLADRQWRTALQCEPRDLNEKEVVPVWAVVSQKISGTQEHDLQKAINTCPCALVVYLWWEHAKR